MKCGNKFVADWFELNLNINNVLTAITCRKYGFDKTNYIVGHNEIAGILGINYQSSKNLLSRTLRKLRRWFSLEL